MKEIDRTRRQRGPTLARGVFLRGHLDVEQVSTRRAPPRYLPTSVLLDETHRARTLCAAVGAREVSIELVVHGEES